MSRRYGARESVDLVPYAHGHALHRQTHPPDGIRSVGNARAVRRMRTWTTHGVRDGPVRGCTLDSPLGGLRTSGADLNSYQQLVGWMQAVSRHRQSRRYPRPCRGCTTRSAWRLPPPSLVLPLPVQA